MGLTIEVGALATLLEDDAEGARYIEEQLGKVNAVLRDAGLPQHDEPRTLGPEHRWSADMWGYSGLHYLRRIAAHLAFGRPLPPPGTDEDTDDPLIDRYIADVGVDDAGWLKRMVRMPRPRRDFDHLIIHGDAEGFYMPFDFAEVLDTDPALEIAGGLIGSSVRLLRECDRLASALGIPDDIDSEDEALWEAADAQGEGEGWRRYGVEAFTCVRLREAARQSVASGSVIVFM